MIRIPVQRRYMSCLLYTSSPDFELLWSDKVGYVWLTIGVKDVYKRQVLGYGIQFLLPCIIGVIAAILFFMERDNDTFKNLRTIPVTSTQMVLAKIVVLFLFGIVFCVASTLSLIHI